MPFTVCSVLSEKPWRSQAVVYLLLALIICLPITDLVPVAVKHFGMSLSKEDQQFLETAGMSLAMYGMAFACVAGFLRWQNWKGISFAEAFGFNYPRKWRAIVIGIMAGILVLPLAWSLQWVTVQALQSFNIEAPAQEIVEKLQSGKLSLQHQIGLGIIAVFIAPPIEEIFFRGIIYPTIKQSGYPKIALWVTSLLFAAAHFNAQSFVSLLVLAMVLALIYEETNNLLTSITAHAVFNLSNLALLVAKQVWPDKFSSF